MTDESSLHRRQLLKSISGVGASISLAGCSEYVPDTDSLAQNRTETPTQRSDAVTDDDLEIALGFPDTESSVTNGITFSADLLLDGLSYEHPVVEYFIAKSDISELRFPGGITSNFYDWESDTFMTHPVSRPPDYFLNEVMFPSKAAYDDALARLEGFQGKWSSPINWPGFSQYGFDRYLELTSNNNIDRVIALNLSTSPKATVPPEKHVLGWLDELEYTDIDRFEIGVGFDTPVRYFNQIVDGGDYVRTIKPVIEKIDESFDSEITVYTGDILNSERIAANKALAELDSYDSVQIQNPPTLPDPATITGTPTETPTKTETGTSTEQTESESVSLGTNDDQLSEEVLTLSQDVRRHALDMQKQVASEFGESTGIVVDNGLLPVTDSFKGTVLEAILEAQYALNWFGTGVDVSYTVPMISMQGSTIRGRGKKQPPAKNPSQHAFELFGGKLSGKVHPVSTNVSVAADSNRDLESRLTAYASVPDDSDKLSILFTWMGGESRKLDFRLPNGEYSFDGEAKFQWLSGELSDTEDITVDSETVSPVSEGNIAVTVPEYTIGVLSIPYN